MRRALRLLLAALLLAGCGAKTEPGITVLTTAQTDGWVASSLEPIGDPQLRHTVVADPARELKGRGGFVIAIVTRTDCTECYRLDGDGQKLTVTGGAPLGVQYGLAHALELFGYRFFHPWGTHLPGAPQKTALDALGKEYAPELDQRRGLHLHTLHPIEALYDFWVPGDANLQGALRTIDWLVKNRGNYLQWAALNDIIFSAPTADAWRAHTKQIVDAAHARGVKVGIGIEMLGKSNLQNAFDLIDDQPDPVEMKRRLHLLLDGFGFDTVNLSFGEFSGGDPAAFVQTVNDVYAAVQEVAPGTELAALIHVGNYPNLQVTYMGTTQLYYFLVKYANPAITPWIHSVMYFDLYEDAGGAYLHDDFSLHRAYIEGRLAANLPVSYFPESAYWIAFDNAVPTYLPLYMRSRFTDLQNLRKAGAMHDHVLFSSGGEWGYWQTDAAVLRMTFKLPDTWDAPVQDFFAPWGEPGQKLAALIARLGEAQHTGLIGHRLAAYIAGRDQIIDAGKAIGIISQPDRHQFDEVAAMTPAARAAFVTATLEPLGQMMNEITAINDEQKALALSDDDPWLSEMNDGFEVTTRRIRFVNALYQATVSYAGGAGDAGWLKKADDELAAGRAAVARRRRKLHDPDPLPILRNNKNPTFYQYGYLRDADSLCFWERERAQARNLILQTGDVVPGCVL